MDWLLTMDWTQLLAAVPMVGLALATAGVGTATGDPPEAKGDADGDGKSAETEPPTVELPAEESLEFQRLQEELKLRRGNEARLRDRLRKERDKSAQGRDDAGDQPQATTLGAKEIAEIVSQTVSQTLSSMGLAKAKGADPIPGLEMRDDGGATYYGQEMDAAQVRLVTDMIRTALKQNADASEPAVKAMQQRLDRMEREAKEREETAARAQDDAETDEMEGRYLGHLRSYGLALCRQHFAHLPETQQKRAAKWFDRDLDQTLSEITDPDGKYRVDLLNLDDAAIAKLSQRLFKGLERDLAGDVKGAQDTANADAREKEPLTRGGAVPDKTDSEPDWDNMTDEQQAAFASDLATKAGVSRKDRRNDGSPTY